MNSKLYMRPDKPRRLTITKREEVADLPARTVPEVVELPKGVECFTTPAAVVDLMIDRADIDGFVSVLEPSAGTGAIVAKLLELEPAPNVGIYELDHRLCEVLRGRGYEVLGQNFLDADTCIKYDRVIMNPPFSKLQDLEHVRKAWECLKSGGRLVAIMSPGAFFRQDKRAQLFREWFDAVGGQVEELPVGSFEQSGTMVNSKLVTINK